MAVSEADLKEAVLKEEHFLYLTLRINSGTSELIGKSLREIQLPGGNLIPVVRREGQNIIPRGDTVLQVGDRLTILGDPEFLKETRLKYAGLAPN